MSENPQLEVKDYKDTLNLPNTAFPMKGDGPRREPEIQKFWFENNVYQNVLEQRKKTNTGKFLLHDGPPYLSSGNIHIGTALNKILKDIVVKYKTLKGLYSPYVPGYDCHGLPIESAVSKDKKKDSADSVAMTPLEIRKQCTEFVLNNRKSQEEKFKRLGVLGDWNNAYMTIYPKFESQQLKLFGQMVDKGYIYRGLKPVYWCATCQTALAEAEIEYVENYKSPSIYASFPVEQLSLKAKKLEKFENLKVVVWTTTPWTIPGNLAVCLNANFDYSIIKSNVHGYLLLANDLLKSFSEKISEQVEVLERIKGIELEGTACRHPLYDRKSPIILGEHVTLETGTGCVHTAPGHGLEDFSIGHKYKLGILSPVSSKGLLTEEAGEDLKGLYAQKAGNQKVIELLDKVGALIKSEDYFHSYPHCWRSKTPIIFRATEQWFCSVEKFRDKALKEIDKVKWIPEVGKNRIYSMVESRTDWCISRQRIWGVPIPAFYCMNCNKTHLNKNIIDHISNIVEEAGSNIWWEKEAKELLPSGFKCDCGSSNFKKETDTMDVWFDSGSTHFAVVDQRDELKNISDVMYLEGSDQHRGWFQSSLLTSVAIKDKAPYTQVLTHGFVLDESGRKMSKSLGNVVDPEKVISEYGADILRLWVASTDYSTDMRIGQNMLKQLAEVYRNIRNTARFMLSNLYDFDLSKRLDYEKLWSVDKYALFLMEERINSIYQSFENYEFYKYYQILQNYCSVDLSSFYFDIVKDRLYTAGKDSISRRAVQTTLSYILESLLKVLLPVLPHLAEDIWRFMPYKIEDNLSVLSLKIKSDLTFNCKENTFSDFKTIRNLAYKALEIARANKKIGKSLEAKLHLYFDKKNEVQYNVINGFSKNELEAFFIVSQVEMHNLGEKYQAGSFEEYSMQEDNDCVVVVTKADGEKCPRCWKYATDIGQSSKHKTICLSCANAVDGLD